MLQAFPMYAYIPARDVSHARSVITRDPYSD
jgi:hypothetical protein